jgi:hypothetical protein
MTDDGGRLFTPRRPWRELSTWTKALHVIAIAGWVVAIASLSTVGCIETAALKQPTIANSEFYHPHNIKGIIRYFNSYQERIYLLAKPIMIGSFVVTAVLFGLLNHLDRRWEREKKQELLNRLAQPIAEQQSSRGPLDVPK